jgi:hypothetical protein
MEDKPNEELKRETYEPESAIQLDVDMVELLIQVVDDLCVQGGELKEQIDVKNTK